MSPHDIHWMPTTGEITLTTQAREIWKIGGILGFRIEAIGEVAMGASEKHTLTIGEAILRASEKYTLTITCGKIDITQPPKITKKSVRRKIR